MTVYVDSDITHSSGQVHLHILKFSEKTSIVASLPSPLPALVRSGETTLLMRPPFEGMTLRWCLGVSWLHTTPPQLWRRPSGQSPGWCSVRAFPASVLCSNLLHILGREVEVGGLSDDYDK